MLPLVIAPSPDEPVGDVGPCVGVWRTKEGTVIAFACSDGEEHSLHVPSVGNFRFANHGAVTAFLHGTTSPDLVRRIFEHSVLPMVLQARGQEGVHASAVLTPSGVVGFCAKAHTGKSTLAYAMSRRGFAQWSDDSLMWELDAGRPWARHIGFRVRLREQSLAHFGQRSAPNGPASPEHELHRAPLTAFYVLRRSAVDSRAPNVSIAPLSGSKALTEILDHAHCFNPFDEQRKRRMMFSYLALLAHVRVYDVRFQPSLDGLDGLVDAILKTEGHSPADAPGVLAASLDTTAAF